MLLDTTEDFKRRKRLAHQAMTKVQHITKDKKISIEIILRAFSAYVASIFLYNGETWKISKTFYYCRKSFYEVW